MAFGTDATEYQTEQRVTKVKVAQSCPSLGDPVGYTARGILKCIGHLLSDSRMDYCPTTIQAFIQQIFTEHCVAVTSLDT